VTCENVFNLNCPLTT